jgi:glutamate N-acetyltransferase / amino-acid N-acetyltransferase
MIREITGGITIVPGIKAAGIQCGIKEKGKDLALITTEPSAISAGLFSRNKVQAESLKLTINHIKYGITRAILINSGNANCCTGPEGYSDAQELVRLIAGYLRVDPHYILLGSTGIIGKKLPLEKIKTAFPQLINALSPEGGKDAAEAILTTDKVVKEVAVEWTYQNQTFHLGGIAKGAGMIQPDLATMLCFLATDFNINRDLLHYSLKKAVDRSFNCITIDGDTSTNDMVICLANGVAGNKEVRTKSGAYRVFQEALNRVTLSLAHLIVQDGEGITKFVEISVVGAATFKDARTIARSVANSLLVKTAFFGEDPNWGRFMMAIGKAQARVNPARIDIALDDLPIVQQGVEVTGSWGEKARGILKKKEIKVMVDMNLGHAKAVAWTTDLSTEYVKLNSQYLT